MSRCTMVIIIAISSCVHLLGDNNESCFLDSHNGGTGQLQVPWDVWDRKSCFELKLWPNMAIFHAISCMCYHELLTSLTRRGQPPTTRTAPRKSGVLWWTWMEWNGRKGVVASFGYPSGKLIRPFISSLLTQSTDRKSSMDENFWKTLIVTILSPLRMLLSLCPFHFFPSL